MHLRGLERLARDDALNLDLVGVQFGNHKDGLYFSHSGLRKNRDDQGGPPRFCLTFCLPSAGPTSAG